MYKLQCFSETEFNTNFACVFCFGLHLFLGTFSSAEREQIWNLLTTLWHIEEKLTAAQCVKYNSSIILLLLLLRVLLLLPLALLLLFAAAATADCIHLHTYTGEWENKRAKNEKNKKTHKYSFSEDTHTHISRQINQSSSTHTSVLVRMPIRTSRIFKTTFRVSLSFGVVFIYLI